MNCDDFVMMCVGMHVSTIKRDRSNLTLGTVVAFFDPVSKLTGFGFGSQRRFAICRECTFLL